jgi:hypothetical protein
MIAQIEAIAPGVENLSADELDALQRFTLLWTLFEAQMLGNNASARKITDVVNRIEPAQLEGGWFQRQLDYFCNRYIEEGQTNYRFDHLHLRNNDNPELVKKVLKRVIENKPEQLIVCLTIIYRFRNNFFHGIKWAYGLQEQKDNFNISSDLLQEFMGKFQNGI